MPEMTYQQTLDLFHTSGYQTVEMTHQNNRLALCPKMGGRIIAATLAGPSGRNPFFINPVDVSNAPGADQLIFRGGLGGRDWLGPEGCGDLSFYFHKPPLTMDNWYVDDRQSLPVMTTAAQDDRHVLTTGAIHMPNLRGNNFDIRLDQDMTLLTDLNQTLGLTPPPNTKHLAFQRITSFTNLGPTAWNDDYGCCLIWFVLMLRSADHMFIIAPYQDDPGPEVIDYHFDDHAIPADRLITRTDGQYIIYQADGLFRGKIGLTPQRSAGIVYALDLTHDFLTVLRFDVDPAADYLDNRWTEQAHTTGGDAMDAYNNFNDCPELPGRFCELEAVSSALRLAPNQSAGLKNTAAFFHGPKPALLEIIKATSGRDLTNETFTN